MEQEYYKSGEIVDIAEVRCNQVLDQTKDKEDFDPSFIEKMLERIQEGRGLTEKQVAAIRNIHDSFCD